MQKIFSLLSAGAEAEVYQLMAEDETAAFSNGRLQRAQSRALGGYALRVLQNGRLGFATATRDSSIPWMVQAALETAALGNQTKLCWPTATVNTLPVDQQLYSLTSDQLVAMADEMQRKVQAVNPDFQVQASATLVKERAMIQNTAGGCGSTERVRLQLSGGAELVGGQDILNIYSGCSVGRLSDLNVDAWIDATFGLLPRASQVVAAQSGPQPVVLTGKAFANLFVGPLLAAFSGRNVQQRTSPLAGRLGEAAFSQLLTIVDDATLPMAPSSASVDDEGVATQRFPLAEAGVVKAFAYDLNTAAQAGTTSTGHARKIGRTSGARLNSRPAPGFSNIIVRPGQQEFDDLLKVVGNGVVIDQISGTPGFNPSGEFSVTIQLGYLVKNGQLAGRIKNAMLTGSVFTALNQILAMGANSYWIGGGESGAISAPALAVNGLTVTAE